MESMNDVLFETTRNIMFDGINVSPRGIKTKELIAQRLSLTNPRARIATIDERSTDIFYAFGEFFWYLSGSNKLNFIEYYAPSIGKFSDDNKTLNSAYGYNIFNKWFDQWERCIDILKKDTNSRHAVIFIREPIDLVKNTKDSICTNTLSFLIRDNKLYMVVNMRSCDAFVGLLYDIFCFTMLHELMTIELNVELGEYIHVATSLHIYENWFDIANKIICNLQRKSINGEMKQMIFFNNDIWEEIADVLKYEQMIRTEPIEIIEIIEKELQTTIQISSYWAEILLILIFKRYFIKQDYNKCSCIIANLQNNLYAELLRRKLIAKNKEIAR